MTSPATSPQPRHRRKQARPQELLDAALALFVEKGFAAARSEEVAARAGVSKGTLYLYFPSKEELFKAVVRGNLSVLIAEAQQLAEQFEGPSATLLRRPRAGPALCISLPRAHLRSAASARIPLHY